MIRRFLPTNTCIGVLVCALAPLLNAQEINAQEPLTVPAGLPDWAFNIPDKVQPTAVRPQGIVRAPGSANEYVNSRWWTIPAPPVERRTHASGARFGSSRAALGWK